MSIFLVLTAAYEPIRMYFLVMVFGSHNLPGFLDVLRSKYDLAINYE
jgi:hypothetical protein